MQTVTEISSDLFLSIPIGLTVMDDTGHILDVNPFFCTSRKLLSKNIKGKTLLEIGILNFEDSISLSHSIILGNGTVANFETSASSPSAKINTISVTPFRYGDIESFLFTYSDITEYRTSEKFLKEKNNSLENITNHLPAMIYSYCRTDEGNMSFDYVSKGCEELLGFTPEELMEDFSILWESIHPEDLAGMMESIQLSATTNLDWQYEYRLKHKNGNYKWVQGRSCPFKKDPGAMNWIGTVFDISDRKKIEKEKEELELRLYQSIEFTPNIAIQWYNRKGEIIYWNKYSERLYGYTSEEAIGKTLKDLIYTEDEHNNFILLLTQLGDSQETLAPFEIKVRNKNNSERSILASIYMIPGYDQDPVFVCMDYDITSQKEAQTALIKSEEMLSAITSTLLDVVWILNREDRVIYKSKEDDILDQQLGSSIKIGHVYQEDLESLYKALGRLKANPNGEANVEYRVYDKQGKVLYLETFGSNQYHNPAINGLVLVTRNITERKLAENEIKSSHLFLNALLNTIPVRVCWKDLNSIYLGGNERFLASVNLNSTELLVGKTDLDLYGEDYSTKFTEKDKYVIQNNVPFIFYEEQFNENEDTRWLLKSKVPLKNAENEIVGVLVASQDITDRKVIEQNVRKKNEELVKINAELDRFVYSASHDLRAPIASVLGLIEVIKMESNKDSINLYLDKQRKALKKMDDFIQEIVHFSRNGRLDIACEPIELNFLIEEIFEQYSYLENAQLIDKKVTISSDLVFCSDRQRLNVIFSNLISNSLKYADLAKGNPYIHIHIEVSSEKAVIIIEDNGEGIPDEYKEKIYDMFFRATINSSGSGIGLYIVKEVISKLEAEIEFSSDLGLGTCFRLTVPNLQV